MGRLVWRRVAVMLIGVALVTVSCKTSGGPEPQNGPTGTAHVQVVVR